MNSLANDESFVKSRPAQKATLMNTNASTAHEARPRLQFRIRTLLVIITFGALLLGWWSDRRRLEQQLHQSQTELQTAKRLYEFAAALRYEKDDEFPTTEFEFVRSAGADAAIPLLAEMLQERDPKTKIRALNSIVYIWRETSRKRTTTANQALPAMIATMHDENHRVARTAMVDVLNFKSETQRAVPVLREIMNDDASPNAAIAATVLNLASLSADVKPRLVELLYDDQRDNRFHAAHALGSYFPKGDRPLREALKEEEDARVRGAIQHGLRSHHQRFGT